MRRRLVPRRAERNVFVAGFVCVVGAVVGGGFKAFDIELPVVDSVHRQVLLAGVGLVLVAASFVVRFASTDDKSEDDRDDGPPAVPLEGAQRTELIDRIWRQRIANGLDRSLGHVALIQLGLRDSPDLVKLAYQQTPGSGGLLVSLEQAYADSGRQLGIFGPPGSGKTTQALLLMRHLLEDARQDGAAPIPELFPLASWAKDRKPLLEWLGEQFQLRHGYPPSTARSLVYHHQVMPVLDGLDEVGTEHRAACVAAINEFWSNHRGGPLVLCSRLAEYRALEDRLTVGGAVIVERPEVAEIDGYLAAAGPRWDAVRAKLRAGEPRLTELLTTPLMVSVAVLAYSDGDPNDLASADLASAHGRLWSRYVTQMHTHRYDPVRAGGIPEDAVYSEAQLRRWLGWLGSRMRADDETELWLHEWTGPRSFRLKVAFVLGSGAGLEALVLGAGLITAATVGVGLGLVSWTGPVYRRPKPSFRDGLREGLGITLIALLMVAGGLALTPLSLSGLSFGVIGGLLFSISGVFYMFMDTGPDRARLAPDTPTQILSDSARIGLVSGLVVASALASAGFLLGGADLALRFGLLYGSTAGLVCGLCASATRYAFRVRLRWNDFGPWRWVSFLDWCCDHLYLASTGGAYHWVHLELRDYFAEVYDERTPGREDPAVHSHPDRADTVPPGGVS